MTENIPSPCISVCRMDAKEELCDGCWRSLTEIVSWSQYDDSQKKAVWCQIEHRIKAAQSANVNTP